MLDRAAKTPKRGYNRHGSRCVQFLTGPKKRRHERLFIISGPSVAGAKRNLAELLPPGRGDGALELHIFIPGRVRGVVWIPAADASRMLPCPKGPISTEMPLSPTAIDSSCYLSQERRCLQEDCTAVSSTEEVLRSLTISCPYHDFPVHGG